MKKYKRGPRKFRTEELVNKYYDDPENEAMRSGTRFSEEFDKQKVYRNILSNISRRDIRKYINYKKWQIAASVSILLCFSLMAYQYRQDILNYIDPVETAVKTTAYGETTRLILSDGTIIWLNSGSKLTYPSRFRGNTREISLQGEAYFEVAHNSTPFLIHTDNLTTRVLGTRFNISAYEEDENITVAVVNGKVGLSANTVIPGNTVVVIPNQQAVYSKANRSITRRKQLDAANAISWKEGKLVYRNTPLPEIISDIQRKYDVSIFINESVKDCSISANFNNDSLAKVLKILAELVNGEITDQDSKYFLKGTGCQKQ